MDAEIRERAKVSGNDNAVREGREDIQAGDDDDAAADALRQQQPEAECARPEQVRAASAVLERPVEQRPHANSQHKRGDTVSKDDPDWSGEAREDAAITQRPVRA